VGLAGHFLGAEGGQAGFADDLAESVAFGDARYREMATLVKDRCAAKGIEAPEFPEPVPFKVDAPKSVDLAGYGAVIFATGFRPDYRRWVHFDGGFDEHGFPFQQDGASSVVPGLYFVGVHFLRKRKSSLLMGVGEDAAIVADKISGALTSARPSRERFFGSSLTSTVNGNSCATARPRSLEQVREKIPLAG
jgi:putative flavoprotein involved in K+ transport